MSLFDAFCKSPEVLANQHAGHLELLAFGVDIAFALYEIICINVSWKACSTFSARCKSTLVNQLDVSVIQATFGRRPKFQTLPWELLLLTSRVEALEDQDSQDNCESGLVSGQVLPPGIGSAKLADSCMLVVALCCFLVPPSGAREVPRRFQTISISKQFFIVDALLYIHIDIT